MSETNCTNCCYRGEQIFQLGLVTFQSVQCIASTCAEMHESTFPHFFLTFYNFTVTAIAIPLDRLDIYIFIPVLTAFFSWTLLSSLFLNHLMYSRAMRGFFWSQKLHTISWVKDSISEPKQILSSATSLLWFKGTALAIVPDKGKVFEWNTANPVTLITKKTLKCYLIRWWWLPKVALCLWI